MQEKEDNSFSAVLFGLICIAVGISMFFASDSGKLFGGLMCAVTFGILGGVFTVYGYILSIRK